MNDLCDLSEQECLKMFRYWTFHIRPNLPGTRLKEYLMCPMLWCREPFNDLSSLMQHVSTCDWLSNAWYWCPQCSRPERFMGHSNVSLTGRNHVLRRKESTLRKAVTFFKHLGRKASSREEIALSIPCSEVDTTGWAGSVGYSPLEKTANTAKFSSGVAEIDGETVEELARSSQINYRRPLHEMASRLSHTFQHELFSPDVHRPSELHGDGLNGSDSLRAVPVALNLHQPDDTGKIQFYTNDETQPSRHLPSTSVCVSRVSQHPIQQTVRDSLYETHSNSSALVHPSSKRLLSDQSSAISSSASDSPSSHKWNAESSSERRYPRPLTRLVTSSSCRDYDANPGSESHVAPADVVSSYINRDVASPFSSTQASTRQYVEELRDCFFIVKHDWEKKLSSISDLASMYRLPARGFFELGIVSLKQWYRGTPAETFHDVFAMMHLASASAYILHKDDRSYCWDELFQDMLPWQHMLSSRSDKLLFVKVVEKLSYSERFSTFSSATNETPITSSQDELLRYLRKGRIAQDCSMFLGGMNS